MRSLLIFITLSLLLGCNSQIKENENTDTSDNSENQVKLVLNNCDYLDYVKDLGNSRHDTFRLNNKLIDPIDDSLHFKKTKHGFYLKDGIVYIKSKTYSQCNSQYIEINYFQDTKGIINIQSYKKLDDRYFISNDKVYFWWSNSGGLLMIPVANKDSKSFIPFNNMCGGTDRFGIYYGSPNHGINKLEIPKNAVYKFIQKENHYWNSPQNYIIINNKPYDIIYDIEKGYYCKSITQIPKSTTPKL